ncbi:DUF192 domain-containing protein [Aurantimonas sp. VKM B-3413]|uniref:DUF192 domain-containing protein n=1 Tax=Aurantimonas sp. VKM B-3413 TaxID=2779401 RepID=UPI001E3D1EA3|nr:DUF192 domain-containing protein [Aurantimonas sp. VKM B-3413]MCB8836702.1 DUF192 domain-containing protein [Aurantimonas sp. VKM B-3413]
MMIARKIVLGSAIAVVAVLAAAYLAVAGDTTSGTLVTASGSHDLNLEIAATEEDRRVGLMNRSSMPADHGMLFVFDQTQPVAFWMKNTLIPLDMLFIDESGTVKSIKTNTTPLSLTPIPSGVPVRYVLELNGGAAARYDAKVGDRLESDSIPPK